jgi:hypothetical protein
MKKKETFREVFRYFMKSPSMIKNFISFNNLVSRIGECRKRMTILRHAILLHEESGQNSEHHKRELFNLSNQISLLQSKLQDFHRRTRVLLF